MVQLARNQLNQAQTATKCADASSKPYQRLGLASLQAKILKRLDKIDNRKREAIASPSRDLAGSASQARRKVQDKRFEARLKLLVCFKDW